MGVIRMAAIPGFAPRLHEILTFTHDGKRDFRCVVTQVTPATGEFGVEEITARQAAAEVARASRLSDLCRAAFDRARKLPERAGWSPYPNPFGSDLEPVYVKESA